MKHFRQGLAIVWALGGLGSAMAAITAEEAKQLGTTLTAMGAEKAANKDGSIPEFTNTPITPPADYKPGSGHYTDPYKNEKPLFSIDAKNMDQYADKLSEGTKILLKRWPTYRVDVYPTHRSATYSKWIGENTIRHATTAKLVDDGLGVEGAYGGPPFPIPKSGLEVIWNSFLTPSPVAVDTLNIGYIMDATGQRHAWNILNIYHEYPYYDPDRAGLEDLSYHKYLSTTIDPPRDAGSKNIGWYSLNYAKRDFLVWQYSTGQRRVRLAPEIKYDFLAGPQGQIIDEYNLYAGLPDRYDFKLVGKKEMFVPYNAYRAAFGTPDAIMLTQHVNPDALRWELHRVWVVEGALKPGKSHTLPKRTFYADEDTWVIVLSDSHDSTGKLSRIGQNFSFPMYEGGMSALFSIATAFYNVFKDGYTLIDHFGDPAMYALPVARRPPSDTLPDAMAGSGVR